MPKVVFGPDERDEYTLRRVAELQLSIAFECRNCHKISQREVLDLIELYGLTTKLGDLRPKARCSRCGKRAADILMRSPGLRGARAWWPRPPGATR